ncbi:MAG: hypothetical protein AAF609_12645 [Cyanobacteria bacterium P01_C01_bin.120]
MLRTSAKAKKGTVQFKNTKGRLQIVFSYPVNVDGELRRKRFYISTGFEDTPPNRYKVGDIVKLIQRDIDYGEVDVTLEKYKPVGILETASKVSETLCHKQVESGPTLDRLWEKYAQFKKPQVSPSTYAKNYGKQRNHIDPFPSKSLEDAALIRDYLLANLTLDAAKRCLTQLKACCRWATEEALIEENPFQSMKIKISKGLADKEDINPFTKAERDLIIHTTWQSSSQAEDYGATQLV